MVAGTVTRRLGRHHDTVCGGGEQGLNLNGLDLGLRVFYFKKSISRVD
jgi:hypothetical protein